MKFFIWGQEGSPFRGRAGFRERGCGRRILHKFIDGWILSVMDIGYRFYDGEITDWRRLC